MINEWNCKGNSTEKKDLVSIYRVITSMWCKTTIEINCVITDWRMGKDTVIKIFKKKRKMVEFQVSKDENAAGGNVLPFCAL